MSKKNFLINLFKNYTEQTVPVDLDLWPAIQKKLQAAGSESDSTRQTSAVRDGGSQWYMARLSEVVQKLANPNLSKTKESAMDKEKHGGGASMKRRDFLKVSSATVGAAAVVGVPGRKALRNLTVVEEEHVPAPASEEKLVPTFCRPNCNNGCRMYAHVRDGKVVKTSPAPFPDERYNRICLRGLTQTQQMYSDRRLKYPMKRVGKRGEGKWERISWDEAINTVTDKFKEVQEKYGSTALSFTMGSGNFGMLSSTFYGAYHRLFSVLGASALDNTLDAAIGYGQGRVFGPGQAANDPSDLLNARTILISGANVTESLIHIWHFIAEAMENGTKVIVIDPVYTATASKANQWVPIRAGSDAALFLSMMQVILADGLENTAYIHDHTVGPFLVRADNGQFLRQSHVTGKEPEKVVDPATKQEVVKDPFMVWSEAENKPVVLAEGVKAALNGTYTVNGITVTTGLDLLKKAVSEYTPEHASEITTVDPQVIRDLAHTYATSTPATIFNYMGLDHYDNGHYNGFAEAALAAITGNIGIHGGTIGSHWYYMDSLDLMGFVFPDNKFARGFYTDDLFETAAKGTIMGKPDPIKAMFVATCNPLGSHADLNTWLNTVLPSLDFIATADIYMSETVLYSDIVLPVAHWFEITDMQLGNNHPYILYGEKAVEPLFESKSDYEIMKLIAKKMGVESYFSKSEDEMLQSSISKAFADRTGCTLEKIKKDGVFKVWYQDPDQPNIGLGFNGVFGTPTGRAEFYVENPTPRVVSSSSLAFKPDNEHLPRFQPPIEAWYESPVSKKYPLAFFQEHARWRVHTQYAEVAWLRELDPEPTVKINPDDATARGIAQGDYVEIFNDRGMCVVKAVISSALPRGFLSLPKGWLLYQYKKGSACELTHMKLNPASVNQSYFDVAVEVRKWTEEA
jgi:molybdopterin-containing oxidoreductase family molybdopterin binding subunit